ncbi:MAG: SpaH/EbpB family LPXTG-anchored major pilin [Oscillibacter sp.]|nr:SpaH/EbpB family LPXTG-anchored major pilin [Oscillibacter sp.]
MKHMKKIASLVLALVMALALAVPAFAEDGGKITINNAIPGTDYSIYEIFKLEGYNETSGAYNYTVMPAWEAFFAPGADGADYITIDDKGNVAWVDGADAADFAQKALAWAKDQPIAATRGPITAEGATPDAETATVTFENLELGYYLVDSSAGALCSLNTAAKEVDIEEKNSKPTDEKTVEVPSETKVGDLVTFTATINVGKGAQNYVFHDTIVSGLAFDEDKADIVVKLGETTLIKGSDYTVTGPTETEDDEDDPCTFEIAFSENLELKQGDVITITYKMELTEDAIIETALNEEHVTYGDKHRTKGDEAEVPVYGFDLVKTDSDNKELAGAKFSLYTGLTKDAEGNDVVNPDTIITFVKDTDEDGEEYYRPITGDETGGVTTIEAGTIRVEGLTDGTYYLVETEQPEGYNKVEGYTVITINGADQNAEIDQGEWQNGGVHVVNNKGPRLPSTGGIGTTIFYVVGGLLAAGAVILLITKRRMNFEK